MKHGFFKHRLMNEATEVSDGGSVDTSEAASSSSGYDFSQDTSESVISSAADIAKSMGLDPSKYGFDKKPANEVQKEESQGSDEEQEAGQETDEKSILGIVNSLGLIHSENPFEVGSKDELKNLIQMGKDYTQKTQALSEERKVWDSERSNSEKEIESAIQEINTRAQEFGQKFQELEQWTFALNQLKEEAPEIFDEVQRAYSGVQKQFSNPILSKQLADIRAELAETKKGLTQREDKLIKDEFETEFSALSAIEQSYKELGINVSKDDVKKKWVATGLPVEEALNAIYGKMALQAQASKSKVATTQAKLQAKPTGAGNKSRPGGKVPAIDPKLKGIERAQALLNQLRAG